MRLERKTKTNSLSGSAQAHVPVNPVCPNEFNDANGDIAGFELLSGLSKPKPLLEFSFCCAVNCRTVISFI